MERPHWGQGKCTLAGRKISWARRTNSEMPISMTAMATSLPKVPGKVMSPKPVVVMVVTVK
ncbi:hypothetical protein D3C81_2275690 [compost metagenome]